MSTDYEPTKEQVEAMLDEMSKATLPHFPDFREIARFVLRRQHERETRLVAGIVRAQEWLSVGSMDTAQHELSETRVWYNKLDAPKVPTLRDMMKAAAERAHSMRDRPGQMYAAVLLEDWLALEAAVEREERGA